MSAILKPKHLNLPVSNTKSTVCSLSLIFTGEASIHLSGLKTSTSSPKIFLFLIIPKIAVPTFVPAGTNWPFIMSPPGGTNLPWRPTMGGQMRRTSLIIACRYGRLLPFASVIGDEIEALEYSAQDDDTNCDCRCVRAQCCDFRQIEREQHFRRETCIWTTISDFASSVVSPCLMKDPPCHPRLLHLARTFEVQALWQAWCPSVSQTTEGVEISPQDLSKAVGILLVRKNLFHKSTLQYPVDPRQNSDHHRRTNRLLNRLVIFVKIRVSSKVPDSFAKGNILDYIKGETLSLPSKIEWFGSRFRSADMFVNQTYKICYALINSEFQMRNLFPRILSDSSVK